MFWIYTTLVYFYSVNSENIKEVKENLKKVPGFGMFYSPLCSHCQRIHPFWLEVSKKYITDDKVVMFDCDCAKNASLCAQLEPVNAYPTFVKFINNQKIHFEIVRTAEGMQAAIEAIKNVDLSIPCYSYPELFESYPAVIITSPETPKEICNFITDVTKDLLPYYKRRIYYEKGEKKSISGKVNRLDSLPFSGEINIENVRQFLLDVALVHFGNWPLKNLKTSLRRGAFLIYDAPWMIDGFRSFQYDFPLKFLFGSIHLGDFQKLFPKVELSRKNLPVFGILTSDKSGFMLIRNAKMNDVRPYLARDDWERNSSIKTLPFEPFITSVVNNTSFSLKNILYFPPTLAPTQIPLKGISQEEYDKLNSNPNDANDIDVIEEAKKDEKIDEDGDLNLEVKRFAIMVISIVILVVGVLSVTLFLCMKQNQEHAANV